MTIDISTLVQVVRRTDAMATLRSFLVLLAPFLVLWNIAMFANAVRFFLSEDMFSEDSFDYEPEDMLMVLGILAIGVVGIFAPVAFIIREWAARREIGRQFSAISGAILGAVGLVVVAAALSFLLYMMEDNAEAVISDTVLGGVAIVLAVLTAGLLIWLLTTSRWVARILVAILAAPFVLLVLSLPLEAMLEAEPDLQGAAEFVGGALLILLGIGLVARVLVRAIRLRIILASDVPRKLLFGAFVRNGLFVRLAQIAGLPASLWSASAMLTVAFWVLILARPVTYIGAAFLLKDSEEVGDWRVIATAGVALIVVGHLMFYAGKRLAARNSWRPERPGTSAPILFLRSFQDDQLRLQRPWWNLTARWQDLWSFRRNVDEALVDEIAQYGPVVALGQPGEKRAPFGAMRLYSTHEQWQSIVADTARRAQAIVIVAGDSPGVLWEFELLAREKLVERTLLLFRPGFQQMNRRALEAFCRETGSAVPSVQHDRQMIALIQSREGSVLLSAREASAEAYLIALRAHFQKLDANELVGSQVLIEDAVAVRRADADQPLSVRPSPALSGACLEADGAAERS